LEIEVYSCGCKVRIYEVEFGESKNDLTERPALPQTTVLVPSIEILEGFRLERLVF